VVTVKTILDKRKAKKDGTFPICFQICFKRKTTTRSSRIYVSVNHWDDCKKEINKAHALYKILNLKLKKQFIEIQAELLLADEEKITNYLSPKEEIKKPLIESPKPITTVYEFANSLIRELKSANRFGNAWVYESTVNALKGYHPDQTLSFEQIDYPFLDAYQTYLIARMIMPNSIYLYVRTIRIFYNKAIKLKLVDKACYPFDEFKLKPEKTRKRAIDKSLLKQIKELSLDEQSTIWHVRNWFLLSFYLIGISVIDLAFLTPDSVVNNRIEYKRKKTGKWYSIKLLPEASKILDIYLNSDDTSTDYLLPIINFRSKDQERLKRIIKSRTKLLNKYIGELGKLIEYTGKITTYSARHSWATTAKKMGYSNEVIAEALGHEFGNETTNIYLDSFDKEIIDAANEKVCLSIQ
jgi:integrase